MPLTQVSSRAIEDTLRYVLGASGTDHYTFTGKGLTGAVNDPTLTLSRGHTYIFENRSGGHPFYIKTSIANGGTNDQYSTGVTNNGGGNGTEIVFTVPHDAPDLLYYQCSSHSSMAGQLNISGSVTDGSITTAKLAADAVDGTKIADDAINSEHYVDGSIDTVHIANSQITQTKLASDAVTTAKIAGGAVTEPKLAANAINTAKIVDGAVTDAKINGMAASKLTGALPAISGANLTGIAGIPTGVIVLWSGAANAIPSGYVLCDGNNSTPDLRNRFIVGAGNTYSVADTGGADSVTLSTSQIPSHNHSSPSLGILVSDNAGGSGSFNNIGRARTSGNQTGANSGSINMGSNVGSTGGGGSHENRPPYYALCYIMKT